MRVIDPHRRWLVVVAHPDDETLGCGALLSRLREVDVVHVTDGAPRDGGDARRHGFETPAGYAAARRSEAGAALALAGVPEARRHLFGFADQGATREMGAIACRLLPVAERAEAVLTHAYEGGHPDHDAAAFAAHRAAGRAGRPVFEMPFYHAGPDGWIRQEFLPSRGAPPVSPAGRRCLGEAETDEGTVPARGDQPLVRRFAPPSHPRGEGRAPGSAVERLALTPAELALKRAMAACHATQRDTLRSFDLGRELFRSAPAHDFTRLPHDGDLLYERHGWNLDRAGWIEAVRRAEAELAALGWP